MTRIRFGDLPSTNTPINAENLNKLNNVIVSSEEPTTGEEVWIDNVNKKIHTKNNNNEYEEFYNEEKIDKNISDILNITQLKETALKCSSLGKIDANTTTTFSLAKNWGFLFLYNDWGNGGIYAYNMQTAGATKMAVYTIRENSMTTVAGESGTRNVKFTTGQVSFTAYNIYF